MTVARFKQLRAGAEPIGDAEAREFLSVLRWEARMEAAKRAVATKRAKYAKWPCNRRK
jgi:hypothetical protein